MKDIDAAKWEEGMSLLFRSGVLEALRGKGRVGSVPVGIPNYAEVHIAALNQSKGYNQALDDLIEFRDRFLVQKKQDLPLMDFGGVATLLNQGIITEEEANDIKHQLSR